MGKKSIQAVPTGDNTHKTLQYSLVETANANSLRVYDSLEYVLIELAAYQSDTSLAFPADLLT